MTRLCCEVGHRAADVRADAAMEFVWLIERGQPEGDSNTIWWLGERWDKAYGNGAWTFDANEAAKFPTKEAAEAAFSDWPAHMPGRAVEHGFWPRGSLRTEVAHDVCWANCQQRLAAEARVIVLTEALQNGVRVAAQYFDTDRGDLDGWIASARDALARIDSSTVDRATSPESCSGGSDGTGKEPSNG